MPLTLAVELPGQAGECVAVDPTRPVRWVPEGWVRIPVVVIWQGTEVRPAELRLTHGEVRGHLAALEEVGRLLVADISARRPGGPVVTGGELSEEQVVLDPEHEVTCVGGRVAVPVVLRQYATHRPSQLWMSGCEAAAHAHRILDALVHPWDDDAAPLDAGLPQERAAVAAPAGPAVGAAEAGPAHARRVARRSRRHWRRGTPTGRTPSDSGDQRSDPACGWWPRRLAARGLTAVGDG